MGRKPIICGRCCHAQWTKGQSSTALSLNLPYFIQIMFLHISHTHHICSVPSIEGENVQLIIITKQLVKVTKEVLQCSF